MGSFYDLAVITVVVIQTVGLMYAYARIDYLFDKTARLEAKLEIIKEKFNDPAS